MSAIRNWAARLIRRRMLAKRAASRAVFIGITGSSAKTTTSALLSHILRAESKVVSQIGWNSPIFLQRTLAKVSRRTGFVVVEAGAKSPGDIETIAKALKPDVAIVTMVAREHYGMFRTNELMAKEKGWLVQSLSRGGFALLNADDASVAAMDERTAERIVTFGRTASADYVIEAEAPSFPDRLTLRLRWRGGILAVPTRFPALHFEVPVAAAIAAALELGQSPERVVERVGTFEPLFERCGVFSVENGPTFVIDTFKAPEHSLPLAVSIVANASAVRKRIVFGDISDTPRSPRRRTRASYALAGGAADEIIYVDETAYVAPPDVSSKSGLGTPMNFGTPREVAGYIKRTAIAGELILLKSSSSLHLERIALSFSETVRCWVPKCGKTMGCRTCGLYRVPFEDHAEHAKHRRLRRWWRRLRKLEVTPAP